MDRGITYPGAIPLDTDILSVNRNAMIALGYLTRATIGTGTFVDGLPCLPTIPASMQVQVGQGSITTTSTVDGSAYGTIAADNADPLVKTGINAFGSTAFTLTAPGVSGQSINYLIEAQLVEADGNPISLPYYNAANPSQPFTGPNNNQAQQNTVRTQRVGLQLKAGAPAGAGTQQTPGVDASWVGLYIITVNYAQTSITPTSISVYPGAPFIGAKIPALAPLLSPALQGIPTSTIPPPGDNSNRIATTSNIAAALGQAGPLLATGFDAGSAGVRMIVTSASGYGTFFRNDNTNLYLMLTANGSPLGSFNALRPLTVNLATGAVTLDSTGAGGVAIGGPLASGNHAVSGSVTATGNITSSAGRVIAALGALGSGNLNAATILSDFTQSFAGNGWFKLPNGLIVQWGTGGVTSTGVGLSSNNVTLPIPFPNAHWWAMANFGGTTPPSGGSCAGLPNNLSSVAVTVYSITGVTTTYGVTFIAIGQ